MNRFFATLLGVLLVVNPLQAETVTFPASDGLNITADVTQGKSNSVIVLFHMAGASRGEYQEIAPTLNEMGYTTLAVDQRSGKSFGGVTNETAARSGKNSFQAAIPDLKAATQYARDTLQAQSVGVIGSSYSASLVLVLAGQDKGFADAVMSFSPGEYFSDKSLVSDATKNIAVPVFLTAARSEAGQWKPFAEVMSDKVTGFVPNGAGRHGATALLSSAGDEYWTALNNFLGENLPAE